MVSPFASAVRAVWNSVALSSGVAIGGALLAYKCIDKALNCHSKIYILYRDCEFLQHELHPDWRFTEQYNHCMSILDFAAIGCENWKIKLLTLGEVSLAVIAGIAAVRVVSQLDLSTIRNLNEFIVRLRRQGFT